jgi:hypothetical protein
MQYEIQLTPLALAMLAAVKDRREQEKLAERIEQLKRSHLEFGVPKTDVALGRTATPLI